ncbi:zinc finger AN1 domain-containing stress-associated protein [Haloarchaeobius salinus]|uniref:zinc finger AN1 domain-containing stress-associated protein n=1 Tax=Haloarchaeobius salinus TaxID=1198298 RepID=UPI0021098525|nr:zinc finger AN1 domain-containing stress-associated protein [Haloarchaeobius salinus]
MASCSFCGREVDGFPYSCNECGETLCGRHRLPERHDCRGLARVADRTDDEAGFIGRPDDRDRAERGVVGRALDAMLTPVRRLRRLRR